MSLNRLIKIDKNLKDIDLTLIKKFLNPGDFEKIANDCDCSISLVYKVLGKHRAINIEILDAALSIANKNADAKISIIEKSNKLKKYV